METLYQDVLAALQREDKESAVTLCLNALKTDQISVVDLYEMILAPALGSVIEEYKYDQDLIWREHVRSGIIRTIIELCYPYIIEQKKKLERIKGKVVVMCPEYEDHELGAKMVSDFFKLVGFDSTFIGARTPEQTILKAIDLIQPDYLCISVTNYYNLISVKRTIQTIKKHVDYDLKFILGGRAFDKNPHAFENTDADFLVNSYEEVRALSEEVL